MRIAYAVPRFTPHTGGVETHVAALARRVAEAGHHVEVLTPEARSDVPPVEAMDGVLVRRFRVAIPSRSYPFAPALFRHLQKRAYGYDLIHAHSYHALPALGAALTPTPLVFTPHYHGTGHTPVARALHAPYRVFGNRIFARAGRIICVSASEAELVARHFPGTAARLTVIPNGVHAAPIRAALPYETDRAVILSVGRLERYKRVDAVVRAIPHLDDRFRLVVIGEGPERGSLETLVRHLGAAPRVSFLGRLDDGELHRWYRTAMACVSMSEHEAYGLTLIESAIAGAAVVASAIPAHRDVAAALGDAAQLLTPSASPHDLAAAITAVVAQRPDRGSALDVLDWDDVATRTLELYEEILPSLHPKHTISTHLLSA